MRKFFTTLIAFLFFLIITVSFGQNSPDFFKTIPVIDDSTPEWAMLMYSDNPNVAEVEDMYRAYYRDHEFVKTIHTQNHKYWIRLVEPLLDQNGFIRQKSRAEEDYENKTLKDKFKKNQLLSIEGSDKGWVAMGPFETFKKNTDQAISWHKNIYSIDQSESNPDILICGTEAGGVYKTTDRAAIWFLISKGEVFSGGNSAVKIHPTDPDNFLVASNKRIYQSLDGGLTWVERHFTSGAGNEFQYSPSDHNIIFHTSTSGLFKSTDGGTTWTQIYSESCWDIDFHPSDFSVAYLLKSNTTAKRCEFFRSDDGGSSWELKDNGYYIPADIENASISGGKIAVTPASADLVYVCLIGASKTDDNGWIGVYKSTDKGDAWTNPSGQDGGPYGPINGSDTVWNVAAYSSGYHQGFFNFDLEASPTDPDKIWIATIRLTESNDGGKSFTAIGAANSDRLSDFHADVQDIEVNGDEIWVASDGGVNYSNDELNSHKALNKGIQAAHFWGFNTGWNEDTFTGGKYHDGTSGWYEGYGVGNAYNIGGVEEASGYVHPIDNRKLLFREHYASSNTIVLTIPTIFGDNVINHSSLPIRPNESYLVAERSGLYFDPRYSNHIYVGLENKVYKSIDGGVNFNVIFTFPDNDGMIYEMEISRSNPDVIYAVYNPTGGYWDPCEIWKTTDGGISWNKTAGIPEGNNRRFRITINPEDEDNVWICTPRGGNAGKVSSTTDGGDTWINRTTDVLDGEDVTDILYQGGTNDVVYVGSQNGVFYWDANTSNWIDYSTDLPMIAKCLQINPFYRDAELRLGTTGRGVWARKMADTLFAPIAQPITYTDTVFCSRDTVKFDCYSILNQNEAEWEWSFTPDPFFISSGTARNPKVVFGAEGDYDVSLTVTDANGNSSTKTIKSMITVRNLCEPDSVAGNALKVSDDGDYFSAGDLNLSNITHFTATAWIKPAGKQDGFAGIVTNGEWCAHCNTPIGLIFDYYGDKLYYRWPDGSGWGSNSGMTVPLNEWSYVAMVVTPDSVTLYLNDQQWVSDVSLSPVDLPVLYIGKGHYSKYFRGNIDEVTIWNRALSQSEIRDLKHLTKKDIINSEPGLVAYYQFNKLSGSAIFDNGRSNHGWITGMATLETSTAPVGPGVSERMTIDNSGPYSFENTGLEIEFGTSHPEGEIVVSRLNVLPDSLPNSNPSVRNYWIINNYGTVDFSAMQNIKFKSGCGLPIGDPADAILHVRNENEHLNSWTGLCSAQDYTGNTYNFNGSCNITNTKQFFIQSDSQSDIHKWFKVIYIDTIICKDESIFLEGEWQSTEGVYTDTIPISASIVNVNVTTLKIAKVDTSVTVDSPTLISNANDASYQWIDCNNMQPISGETNRSFTAKTDGDYAVEITQNGCTDTSSCHQVFVSGIIQNDFGNNFRVFPNPTTGIINIDLSIPYQSIECKIFNTSGQLMNTINKSSASRIDFVIEGPAGYYLVEIRTSYNKKAVFKILKY